MGGLRLPSIGGVTVIARTGPFMLVLNRLHGINQTYRYGSNNLTLQCI